MDPVIGPDFICIGMPRAGTGWLFDQLQYHPDFWMPPVKEMDYLLRDVARLKNITRKYKLKEHAPALRRSQRARKGIPGRRRPWDARDDKFLEKANSLRGAPRDYEQYKSLFSYKGALKSGDVSPTYISLDEDVISKIAEHLPRTKIIFLIRDPIARAASQISMAYRHGKFDSSILDDPGAFRAFLETSVSTKEQSFPTAIVSRWMRYAPEISFRTFFFDSIEKNPDQARREILTYLGANPEQNSGSLPPSHNRKAHLQKLSLPDAAKAILIQHFAPEVHACAAMFGSYACDWVTRYYNGQVWDERPPS